MTMSATAKTTVWKEATETPCEHCSGSLAMSDWLLTACRKYFASFGGLLLYMEGPHRKLSGLKIDDIYMLVKHS